MGRLYSNLKIFRHTDRLAALLDGRAAAPVHVRIKPTNRCNQHCWYCAYRADNLTLGEGMNVDDRIPAAKMFEIVDDLVAMGVEAVTFSGGGEPLLYPELPAVIDRLRAGGVRVGALTNGSNLKGRMADAFAAGGTWIRVSLDACDGAAYAVSRGVGEDAFDRLLANIADFTARRSACVLGVSLIVTADNCHGIAGLCRQLKDIGVNHVKISGAIVANTPADNNTYHRRIADTVAAQITAAKTLADGRFAIVDHYHESNDSFDKGYSSCPFSRFLTVIGADCRVYTCQDKAYTDSGLLGSIAERRFRELWFADDFRARLAALDPSVVCGHHCVAHGKNLALHEVMAADPEHGRFV
jgi:MoaA/NifB/PqqE/SkfB family radical SAM enzyme